MSLRLEVAARIFLTLLLIVVSWLNRIEQTSGQVVGGAECGVYAMAAAAAALKLDCDRKFIEEGLFVNENGSSAAQLRQLASELGLWTRALEGVSIDFVRNSSSPMLLNLRRSMVGHEAGHWVTYLGDEDGLAIIFDNIATEKIRTVRYGELCLMMSGEAVIVDLTPPSRLTSVNDFLFVTLLTWIWVVPGLLALFCIPAKGLVRESFLVLLSGAVAGVLSSQFSIAGYGRNPSAVAYVASTRCEDTFPEVSYQQMIAMLSNPEVGIVDARPKWLYEAGSIEGSINFPVDSRPDGLRPVLEKIAAKRAVFVFCSGPKCDWDRAIACRLRAAGVVDIRIYEEGLSTFEARKLSGN
jgi:rhodanese-related sulfurtransferase